LRTSVLDRVNGELAGLLTGRPGSEPILLDLEDANAFVESLYPGRGWFRYHRLLADFLRLELRRCCTGGPLSGSSSRPGGRGRSAHAGGGRLGCARAEARSVPNGFSMITRAPLARPDSPSMPIIEKNAAGGTARWYRGTGHGSGTFS